MVRVRSVVPVLLIALTLTALTAVGETPPANLHRVGDHWTAYNPPDPATYPPGARVHVIERGDTLWALAERFYGNPYLWPQLWENNTWITNAHWIYPGDPLLVAGETAASADVAPAEVITEVDLPQDADATVSVTPATAPLSPPIALASESDILCFGYLGHPDERLPNVITSFEDAVMKLSPGLTQPIGVGSGEIVYVNGGDERGLVAGETYMVVHPAELVYHPATGALVGRHYDFRGQVRILCLTDGNGAIGYVERACSDIRVGDRLKPLPELPIPIARLTPPAGPCTPPTGKVAGFIVNAKDYRFALGEGALVEINLGHDDFIQPGDFLTVFRNGKIDGDPRLVLGEIAVLTTEARTATAAIVRMRYSMEVGDQVELK